MSNRVEQMKEIHAESIDREIANCDIDNNVYWDNPIKSLGLIVELGDRLQKALVVTNEFVTVNNMFDIQEILFDIHSITIMVYGVLTNFTNSDNPNDYIHENPEVILQLIKKVHNETLEIFKKKNSDYGDAFATYGMIGVIVRIGDKIMRIKSLTNNKTKMDDIDNKVMDESVKDTLYDLINYTAMAIMLNNE